MPNTKNVEALRVILKGMFDGDCGDEQHIAEQLAARGVLVPATLTDSDCERLTVEWDSGTHYGTGDGHTRMREELERIATYG